MNKDKTLFNKFGVINHLVNVEKTDVTREMRGIYSILESEKKREFNDLTKNLKIVREVLEIVFPRNFRNAVLCKFDTLTAEYSDAF